MTEPLICCSRGVLETHIAVLDRKLIMKHKLR
jgi:hypothetical protein